MDPLRMTIAVLLFSIGLPAGAEAALYTWIDSAGREHFVDDLAKVPAEYRDQAARHEPSERLISVQPRPPQSASGQERGEATPSSSGKDESQWRNEANEIRRQIKQRQADLEFYYRAQQDCAESQKNVDYSRKRDCANLYTENLTRTKADIELLQKRLENDLPEEARKAGASPGWLRENTDSAAPATGGQDEASWRQQARDLRRQLKQEQSNLAVYEQQERECEEQQRYVTGCRKKNCKVMYEDRKKWSEHKIGQLKQKLEVELPEEARKAGAYPGWVRE